MIPIARLDKWLWAARFFKTRSVAAAAITGGKIRVNEERPKAGLQLKPGDQLRIRKKPWEYTIVVKALSIQRGPAKEAILMYEETPESVAAREELALALKQQANAAPRLPKGRPTKRDRRKWLRVRGRR